jgi:glutamyl-tRNA reductase
MMSAAEVVAALRDGAAHVIDSELSRLSTRVRLDAPTHTELVTTLDRIADSLFGLAYVQIIEHAARPEGDRYLDAVQELFSIPTGGQKEQRP